MRLRGVKRIGARDRLVLWPPGHYFGRHGNCLGHELPTRSGHEADNTMSQTTMLSLRLRAQHADAAQGLLLLAGALGFEWRDAGVDGAIPVGEVHLITYGSAHDLAPVIEAATDVPGLLGPPAIHQVDVIDWAQAWKVHFKPLRLSPRRAVVPSWERWKPPVGVNVIAMDPGSAFGTGQHATTALCLRALDQIDAEGGIGALADIGCGTGILGIGAMLLGVDSLWMTDNDPMAVEVAAENLRAMDLLSQVELTCADTPEHTQIFDTVVANILAPVLIRLASHLSARVSVSGRLLLSGLLVSQIDEVEAPFLALGWHRARLNSEGEWALLWLER